MRNKTYFSNEIGRKRSVCTRNIYIYIKKTTVHIYIMDESSLLRIAFETLRRHEVVLNSQ